MTDPVRMQQGSDPMTKDELRAALAVLDAEILASEKAAGPYRNAVSNLEEKREILLEENEVSFVAKCDFCRRILFEGDMGCRYGEDGDYLCEECAPTLSEALADMKRNESEYDADEFAQQIGNLEARVAAEGPDVKPLSPL